jgi:hypothetical protein
MKFLGSRAAGISNKMKLAEEHARPKLKSKEIEIQNDFNEKYKTNIIKEDEISIRRIPYVFWIFGTVCIIVGFYLLYSIIIGPESQGKLFSGLDNG